MKSPYLQTSPDLNFNFITSTSTPSKLHPPSHFSHSQKLLTPQPHHSKFCPKLPLKPPDSFNTPKKSLKLVITPVQNYYFSSDSPSRKIAKHQTRKDTLLALSTPVLVPKPKEKLKITSLNSSLGPSRNFNSMKYRYLLLSNYDKMTSEYFYKENEDLKDFIREMKLEGFHNFY